jgi:hypothetical protein
MKRLIVQVSGAASIDRPPHLAEAFFNRQRYGGDWLLKAQRAGLEWLSRLFSAMTRICTLLCSVVFVVGPIQDEIVFDCMHASKF